LERTIDELGQRNLRFDSVAVRYELRDLYWANNRTADAIQVMSAALDLLSEIGSQRGVDDVESWLRQVDQPRLTRVAIERHVPDSIVDQILSGELSLPKPRKQTLTILFSDLRGFTSLSEKHDPEDVVDLLNEWFSEATRAVQKHGGIVDKFIGDAVMALFGVNSSEDEVPENAVRAALDMRSALASMNKRNAVLGVAELSIGIGIATGEAVVGFMGSHLRHAYTAIGDTVNIAARLESETRNFENCDIIIDERTKQTVSTSVATRALGDLQLKGREQTVGTFSVK
jgi:adenylate cyclase